MQTRLTTFPMVLSLGLLGAILALWLRSYSYFDDLDWFPNPQRFWELRSAEGRLSVQQTWSSQPIPRDSRFKWWIGKLGQANYYYPPFAWRIGGFGYGQSVLRRTGASGTVTVRIYMIPHAFAAVLFALAPGLWIRKGFHNRRRRARIAAGLCPCCGYDLRASPGRCPECGAVTGEREAAVGGGSAHREDSVQLNR